jgi:hypothetical protein
MTESAEHLTEIIRKKYNTLISDLFDAVPDYYLDGKEAVSDPDDIDEVNSLIDELLELIRQWMERNGQDQYDYAVSPVVQRLLESQHWLKNQRLKFPEKEYEPCIQRAMESQHWYNMLSALTAGL